MKSVQECYCDVVSKYLSFVLTEPQWPVGQHCSLFL